MDMSDNFVSGNPNMSDTDLNHMPRGFGISLPPGRAICVDDPPNMSWIRHNLFQDITAQAVNVTGAASLAVTGKAPDTCVPSIPVPQLVRQTNDEINQPVERYWSPEEPLYDQTTPGHQGHQQGQQLQGSLSRSLSRQRTTRRSPRHQQKDDYDYEYGFYDPGPANLEEAIREYEERYAPSRASR